MQGDAESLPFPEQPFDAVINIDSAYHYPHHPRFLAEVARVLRPGGHFLEDMIDRRVPAFLHGFARADWAVRGTRLYREVQSGAFTYRMYCFAKA